MTGKLTSERRLRLPFICWAVTIVSVCWSLQFAFAQEQLAPEVKRQAEAEAHRMTAEDFYDHGKIDEAITQ